MYASENSSLAMLETLAHVSLRRLPRSLVAVRIRIPEDAPAGVIRAKELPKSWREAENPECARIGSAWLEHVRELVLRVPSAVNALEENVLLNPRHRDIERCVVDAAIPIAFDPRTLALIG